MRFSPLLVLATAALANCVPAKPSQTETPLPAIPATPKLEYLVTCNLTLGPAVLTGNGPLGSKMIMPITGGEFSGPKFHGKVVPFGIDGLVLDAAGIPHPWVEAHLAPSNGSEIIVLEIDGSGQPGKGAFLGAKFTTGNDAYEWLNYVVAIGRSKIDDPKKPTFASLELFQMVG